MNMTETQAAGLHKMFNAPPPAIENDAKVFAAKPLRLIAEQLGEQPLRALPDVPRMIVEAQHKAGRIARLDELVGIAEFIGDASPLECKHIINMLADRVSTLTGCATELEDAACALTREIESDATDCLRSYMERRDEA